MARVFAAAGNGDPLQRNARSASAHLAERPLDLWGPMSYVSYEMAEQKRISEARGEFSELVNRAAYRHERVLLTRHGKAIAAIVPTEDLELLEALEDRDDLEAVRAALADPNNQEEFAWEHVRADLGL